MKFHILAVILLFMTMPVTGQAIADLTNYKPANGVSVTQQGQLLAISWPAGNSLKGKVVFDLHSSRPLFKTILLGTQQITADVDPKFVITVGERDLLSQNGWNIFFDKVPDKPYQSHPLVLEKTSVSVRTEGSRTITSIGPIAAAQFSGMLEVTFYNGSPLFNVAAVISTAAQAKAIVFDAGLVSSTPDWQNVSWMNKGDSLQQAAVIASDTAHHLAVKYRAIAASGKQGTIAVFPPPHQYFYPLDEAFNLDFTWYGRQYRQLIDGYGIGIRQELHGDKRFVP
jgi:hypothetical protein